jgi:hypothetical protein
MSPLWGRIKATSFGRGFFTNLVVWRKGRGVGTMVA